MQPGTVANFCLDTGLSKRSITNKVHVLEDAGLLHRQAPPASRKRPSAPHS